MGEITWCPLLSHDKILDILDILTLIAFEALSTIEQHIVYCHYSHSFLVIQKSMKMFATVFQILTLFTAAILADVQFVTPTPGTTIPSNAQISVSWADAGGQYPLPTLKGYTLSLWVGGSTETVAVSTG